MLTHNHSTHWENTHLNNWQFKEMLAAAPMSAVCFRGLGVTMFRDILRAFILSYHQAIKGSFSKRCHYSSSSKQFKHWRQHSEFQGVKTEEKIGSITNEITVVCLGVAAPSVQHAHMTVVGDNNQIMLPLRIRQTPRGRKAEPVINPRSSKRSRRLLETFCPIINTVVTVVQHTVWTHRRAINSFYFCMNTSLSFIQYGHF